MSIVNNFGAWSLAILSDIGFLVFQHTIDKWGQLYFLSSSNLAIFLFLNFPETGSNIIQRNRQAGGFYVKIESCAVKLQKSSS